MSGVKLGELLPNTWSPRDAVHVAVIPVEAGERLAPGTPVQLSENTRAVSSLAAEAIGVVDPYLLNHVEEGQCFLLLLRPGTITGLQHQWSHPSFPTCAGATVEEKAESEAWLSDFIGSHYDGSGERVPMYKEVITSIMKGEGGTIYGREAHGVPWDFWFHLERLTGRQISASLRESTFFGCGC